MINIKKLARDIFKNEQKVIILPSAVKIILRKGVFIPDEKTILFISTAIKLINKYKKRINIIADVGTGSGIIAISIAKRFPEKMVYAYDISARALRSAKDNAAYNQINNISFFKNRKDKWLNSPVSKKIDLVIANPPYVGDIEYFSKYFLKEYPDARHQPIIAIRTYDKYGLKPYIGIFNAARMHNVGYLFFRCNTNSIDKVSLILSRVENVKIKKMTSKIGHNAFLFLNRT